ncbi:hypothetical protein FB471_3543 [Amycolatopsis cihanbeyliensis]|uniref:Uncharacterized protein n=2 Tax=Amycolatopsis cihanbeyliensis TaxID=1128664 RepID=A0A542DLE7_AMYCI|nr:hypothetical protein FB471_3543 [Amycolatopsis cihanbeyliensis]
MTVEISASVDSAVDQVENATDTSIPAAPRPPRLEAMPELEWSQAIELPRVVAGATKPSDIRRAWIHRAAEEHVLALYRVACQAGGPVPAPWWLRALAAGELPSREYGFRVEDRIAQLLGRRPGWEYVPWSMDGESGYWEFMPSEGGKTGHRIPTTVLTTDRHPGWIDVLPAHSQGTPDPITVAGLAGLRSRLGEFEAVR